MSREQSCTLIYHTALIALGSCRCHQGQSGTLSPNQVVYSSLWNQLLVIVTEVIANILPVSLSALEQLLTVRVYHLLIPISVSLLLSKGVVVVIVVIRHTRTRSHHCRVESYVYWPTQTARAQPVLIGGGILELMLVVNTVTLSLVLLLLLYQYLLLLLLLYQ